MTSIDSFVFNFFDKKKEGRELSNFWEGKVVVDGREYNSGESAFHGSKYLELSLRVDDEKRKAKLRAYGKKFEVGEEFGAMSGAMIKKKGGKTGLRLTEDELGIWTVVSVDVQRLICKYKFDTYEEVKKVLLGTGDKVLVHPAMRCSEEKVSERWWEGRGKLVDGKVVVLGNNILGKLWMELRDDKKYV